jgi:hypothetical protein
MRKYIIVVALLLSSINSLAQRRVEAPTSTGCFRQIHAPILYAPPLHSDMPLDALHGYMYFDSLSRSFTGWSQVDSFATLITGNDTLKHFLKYRFAMSNYDDILFSEYLNFGQTVNSMYKTTPGYILQKLTERENLILGSRNKKIMLTHASLILHLKITSVHLEWDSLAHIPVSPLVQQCITAQVLDTIKGMHFLSHTASSGNLLSTPSILINFSLSPLWGKGPTQPYLKPGVDYRDSANVVSPCANCFGTQSLIPGSEYIVFLGSIPLDYDGTNAFYDYWPVGSFEPQGGLFPIVSGNVIDSSNYWGYGTSVSLSQFESSLKADIHAITQP